MATITTLTHEQELAYQWVESRPDRTGLYKTIWKQEREMNWIEGATTSSHAITIQALDMVYTNYVLPELLVPELGSYE